MSVFRKDNNTFTTGSGIIVYDWLHYSCIPVDMKIHNEVIIQRLKLIYCFEHTWYLDVSSVAVYKTYLQYT